MSDNRTWTADELVGHPHILVAESIYLKAKEKQIFYKGQQFDKFYTKGSNMALQEFIQNIDVEFLEI